MRKILAIDGGGIKGVVPAAFLATVEDALGENVANYFDLIAGTSTGGIVALGLGLGMSGTEILHFYENLGPTVFKANRFIRGISQFGVAKYHQEPLRHALEATFGDRKLGESTKRLVIPSLNLETGDVHIFKTAHHPRFEMDYKLPVVDVALATAAAPTYFPTSRSTQGIPLIDGGMWANNPTGLSVVEAIGVLDWPRESLLVLSLGCTTQTLDIGLGRSFALGLGYWGLKIVDVFMAAQSFASLGTASVLIGHDRVLRIDPQVGKGRFSLDNVKEIASLRGLGVSAARTNLLRFREMFCDTHAEPFEPYRKLTNPPTPGSEIARGSIGD